MGQTTVITKYALASAAVSRVFWAPSPRPVTLASSCQVCICSLLCWYSLINKRVFRTKRADEKGIEEEKAHLSEELEERFGDLDVENMTEEERDFHYFRLHDFDQNNLLDGLEVFKALIHEHEHGSGNGDEGEGGESKQNFDDIVEMIDKVHTQRLQDFDFKTKSLQVLEQDDANKDGFLSYSEFVAGRRRAFAETGKNSEF